MVQVLLVVHLMVALVLVFLILIQRSEGGGLGIGGGGMMSARGTANFLTRATAVVATMFILLSITMTVVSRGQGGDSSVIERVPEPLTEETGPVIPEDE